MIIIALISPTGGAGRTSLAIATASNLSQLGRKVTLIQADPINNLELQLGHSQVSTDGLGTTLLQRENKEAPLQPTNRGFKILPFGQVNSTQQVALDQILLEQTHPLIDFFRQPCFQDNSIVIVDLPRWPSPWCEKIMALSDLNLVTLLPDSTSLLGIDSLLPHLLKSRGTSYFLMNRFDCEKVLHLDLWTLCKIKLNHRLLPFYLHEDQAMPESIAAGVALQEYAPSSQLVEDHQKLCNWIDSEIK